MEDYVEVNWIVQLKIPLTQVRTYHLGRRVVHQEEDINNSQEMEECFINNIKRVKVV
jgi:hypothetical protein